MKANERTSLAIRFSVAAFFFLFFSYLGMKYLGSEDFTHVLRWWLTLLVIGVAFQPFCILLFRHFQDGGWMFAKTIGIAVSGWFLWFLSSIHVLKFTRTNCILCVVLLCAGGFLFYYFTEGRKNRKNRSRWRQETCCLTPSLLVSIQCNPPQTTKKKSTTRAT